MAKEPEVRKAVRNYRGRPKPVLVRDQFLARCVRALGNDMDVIAEGMSVKAVEITQRMYHPRYKLLPVDRDPFWIALADYADFRVGELMSVREELQRMLNRNRKDRLIERMRQENR